MTNEEEAYGQMGGLIAREFSKWLPLFEQYIPQYVEKCSLCSAWDSANAKMSRWSKRLHIMEYECSKVMNGLGLIPAHFLNDPPGASADGVWGGVLEDEVSSLT